MQDYKLGPLKHFKGSYLFVRIATVNFILGVSFYLLYSVSQSSIPQEMFVPPAFVPADTAKQESFQCKETFNTSLEDNLNVIKNYPSGIADQYLWKIGGNMSNPHRMREFPVFVTAVNKVYYPLSQGLFLSLHQRFKFNPKYAKDVRIIVYDLGLTTRQAKMLLKHCHCELRKFPFEHFPAHVRTLKKYAFKPIIVQQLLMEFGFVWWMDSSVRFTTSNIDDAITYAKAHSMLLTVTTSDRKELSLTKQTDVRTFKFFKEDRCKFAPFGETWATTVMFHFDRYSQAVVKAWAVCALNSECIAPEGSLKKLLCHMELKHDGRCHRFDQSALSIISRRLLHEQNAYPLDLKLNNIYMIERTDLVTYFESCVPMIRCLW